MGAGPGNPGLLTLRALECLRLADLVVYDKLVPVRILDYAPSAAAKVCVTELAPRHVERCGPVHQLLIEAAQQGKKVVRLKGGDPFVFGRGGEEAEALRAADIPFEIVPGVTAALGAAACAGIPLTHRSHASAVAFVTGHENPTKPESTLDWSILAHFPGTLVVYMGIGHLENIEQALLKAGKPPETPVAAIQSATTGEQRIVECVLRGMTEKVRDAGLISPAVVVIGPVVEARSRLAWFEARPLFGKRILVTRPRHQAGAVIQQLELLGAVVHLMPTVEIRDPADWSPVDEALAHLDRYDWLVFTSVNGVHAFLRRLLAKGRDLRTLGPLRLAAIGPATAEALHAYHLHPDLVPAQFSSEGLAVELKAQVGGRRVLLARADRGRDLLRQELSQIAEVDQVAIYSQVDVGQSDPAILDLIRAGELDYVLLTSSNIARSFVKALDDQCRAQILHGKIKLVSISPVTSEDIKKMGLPVAAEARKATMAGLVEILVREEK